MNRKQKEVMVAELTTRLSESQAIFLTGFKGLKVEEMRNLRSKVNESGGRYEVVKNTFLRLACREEVLERISDLIVDNNALGTTTADPLPLAKALVDFSRENEKLIIKGGLLSGQALTCDQIKTLADMPSREVLLATLFGTMNAVPTGLVRVLSAVQTNFVYALAAIRDLKEQNQT
ncbi:MAG: 50S ribosomal protein L10 [Thermodesulfobacteriota bacterium]|nr:50S ribosomal protein L10 [Thermodesulfobacteriota bacterium]